MLLAGSEKFINSLNDCSLKSNLNCKQFGRLSYIRMRSNVCSLPGSNQIRFIRNYLYKARIFCMHIKAKKLTTSSYSYSSSIVSGSASGKNLHSSSILSCTSSIDGRFAGDGSQHCTMRVSIGFGSPSITFGRCPLWTHHIILYVSSISLNGSSRAITKIIKISFQVIMLKD